MPDRKLVGRMSDDELCERLLELSRKRALSRSALNDLKAQLDLIKARGEADKALVELNKIAQHASRMLAREEARSFISVFISFKGGRSRSAPVTVLGPPRIVENIIWFVLPRRLRDAVLGDAEESFRQTLSRGCSHRAACFDYCKEAMFAVLFALWSPILRLLGFFRKSS